MAAHADQLRRMAADEHPARFGMLVAAESAGGLLAAEMSFAGLPWRADVHDSLLAGLLGQRAPAVRPAAGQPGWPSSRPGSMRPSAAGGSTRTLPLS